MNIFKRALRAKKKSKKNRIARSYGAGSKVPKPSTCPFRGKDRYSGMWRKFESRTVAVDELSSGGWLMRQHCLITSKY